MLWVCNSGPQSEYYDLLIRDRKIYFCDFSYYVDISPYLHLPKKKISKQFFGPRGKQLLKFCSSLQIDDYVLLPHKKIIWKKKRVKRIYTYTLCKVVGDYEYSASDRFHHSRPVQIIVRDIPLPVFPKDIRYSLYQSFLFYAIKKNDKKIMDVIKQYMLDNGISWPEDTMLYPEE